MTLEIIANYSSPTLLYVIGIVLVSVVCIRLWLITDRYYTERAEDYWNREYLDYSNKPFKLQTFSSV